MPVVDAPEQKTFSSIKQGGIKFWLVRFFPPPLPTERMRIEVFLTIFSQRLLTYLCCISLGVARSPVATPAYSMYYADMAFSRCYLLPPAPWSILRPVTPCEALRSHLRLWGDCQCWYQFFSLYEPQAGHDLYACLDIQSRMHRMSCGTGASG